LAGSTSKRVHIQRFDREPLLGFVNPVTYLADDGLELLTLSGTVATVPYSDVKTVYFVRDFDSSDPSEGRRAFLSRPKLDGVWIRFRFRDRDTLEAVMGNNLLQIDSAGFHCIPPHGAQRVFVPRAAVTEVQVLGVVGSPLRSRKKKPGTERQIGLPFEESA
jgi:hypothetical protein